MFVYCSNLWRRGLDRLIWVWVEYTMGHLNLGYFRIHLGQMKSLWKHDQSYIFGGNPLDQAISSIKDGKLTQGIGIEHPCLPMVTNSPANQTGNGWKIQLVSIKTPLIIVQIAMFDCQMVIHKTEANEAGTKNTNCRHSRRTFGDVINSQALNQPKRHLRFSGIQPGIIGI